MDEINDLYCDEWKKFAKKNIELEDDMRLAKYLGITLEELYRRAEMNSADEKQSKEEKDKKNKAYWDEFFKKL